MKKLLAITLLIVHLFNLAGYPFLFRYLAGQSSQQFIQKIDNHNYNETELIELKVALGMPYIIPTGDYERYDGEITIEGNHYNYVKRKISGDTLYLLCLPNKQKDDLQIAKNDYGKTVNDFNANKKNDGPVKKSNILNEYHQQLFDYSFAAPQKAPTLFLSFISSSLPDSFIDEDGRPPQLNS